MNQGIINYQLPTHYLLLAFCFLILVALTSLSIGVGVFCVGISIYCAIRKPEWLLLFLVAYIPFEPFLLKFVSQDFYVFARYGSEAIIYLLFVALIFKKGIGTNQELGNLNWQTHSLLLTTFCALFFIGVISLIINMVPLEVGVLGLRQIFRFILLFFVVILLFKENRVRPYFPPFSSFQKNFFGILFGIVLIQSILGIGQTLSGGRLDEFLLPNDRKVIGSIQLTTGTKQFWEHGQRVFGTMGRYDQLGSFLAIMLLMIVAFLYEGKVLNIFEPKNSQPSGIYFADSGYFSAEKFHELPPSRSARSDKTDTLGEFLSSKKPRIFDLKLLVTSYWLPIIFFLGIITLILTYSRASWIAFIAGLFVIGVVIKRDKKMIAGFLVAFVALGIIYVSSGKATRYLIDSPRQTVSERVFEAMSPSRWMGEYYGLGRLFFMINTPRALVTYAPMWGLIGVGPGTFGGGVAQALHYTESYGVLGLPFGIWGSEGHIDNNWFSLLGEIGFIGVLAYVSILGLLFFVSYRLYIQYSNSEEPNTLLKDGVEFPSRNSHLMSQAATPPQAETMLAALRHTSQRVLDSSVAVNSEDNFTRAVGLGYCGVLAAFFCLGFFAMYFEMRTLAPYIWIMGGMVVTLNYKTPPSSIS